jgi:hypothetical protein
VKITRRQLKRIIKEELSRVMNEDAGEELPYCYSGFDGIVGKDCQTHKFIQHYSYDADSPAVQRGDGKAVPEGHKVLNSRLGVRGNFTLPVDATPGKLAKNARQFGGKSGWSAMAHSEMADRYTIFLDNLDSFADDYVYIRDKVVPGVTSGDKTKFGIPIGEKDTRTAIMGDDEQLMIYIEPYLKQQDPEEIHTRRGSISTFRSEFAHFVSFALGGEIFNKLTGLQDYEDFDVKNLDEPMFELTVWDQNIFKRDIGSYGGDLDIIAPGNKRIKHGTKISFNQLWEIMQDTKQRLALTF